MLCFLWKGYKHDRFHCYFMWAVALSVCKITQCDVSYFTHWGAIPQWDRVTHIYVSKLTTIGSDNEMLLIRTLGTNFSENLSEMHSFSFNKMHLKMSSAKWRLFRLCLNEIHTAGLCSIFHVTQSIWHQTILRNYRTHYHLIPKTITAVSPFIVCRTCFHARNQQIWW